MEESKLFDMVIVLYKMTASESKTVQSLEQLLSSADYPELRQIYLIDNSPTKNQPEQLAPRFSYQWQAENSGLAKAYNDVWPQSVKAGCKWLVTLDQDTELNAAYLQKMISAQKNAAEQTALIAPIIYDQKQQISPVFTTNLRPLHNILPTSGNYTKDVMAINSGLAVALDFLAVCGGYNEEFPLDYLDHWLSWQVFQTNQTLQVLAVTIEHELSVLTPKTLSHERYQKILAAETHFYQTYHVAQLPAFKKQLLLRGIKQLFQRRVKDALWTLRQWKNVGGTNGKQKTNT